jgi:hypothetical protein
MTASRSIWMREFQHRAQALGGHPTAGVAGHLYNEGRGPREAAEAMYGHAHTKPARDCTCKVKVVGKLTHKSKRSPSAGRSSKRASHDASRKRKPKTSRDPSAPFSVTKYYETWDEEALEAGETDDKGTDFEDEKMTAREAVHEIKDLGSFEFSESPFRVEEAVRLKRIWVMSADNETNYRTGEHTNYSLFIKGSPSAIRRLATYLKANRRSL